MTEKEDIADHLYGDTRGTCEDAANAFRHFDPVPAAPLFDSNAKATLGRVSSIFQQRGGEYGDTWRDCQWLAIKAVGRKIGLNLTQDQSRKIAAAALFDVKYQRLQGGYKDDSIIDGIAYGANLAAEMLEK